MKKTVNKILCVLLSAVMLFTLLPAFTALAEEAPEIVASGYCGGEGDGTNLSWTLDSEGTLTVSGTGAMKNYDGTNMPWLRYVSSIKTVVFEEGVSHIGSYAFLDCEALESAVLPAGLLSVGGKAFSWSGLREITLPATLVSIDTLAFSNTPIRSVYIPASVLEIGDGAFSGCSLTGFTLDENNTAFFFDDENGVLFSADCTELVFCLRSAIPAQYAVPEGVVRIRGHAFENADRLKSVSLPESLTDIGSMAFSICNKLRSVCFPAGLRSIGSSAFFLCRALTDLELPAGLVSIGSSAFSFCSSITSVYIPESVTTIGEGAFGSCSNLTAVTLPTTLTGIPRRMFTGCYKLSDVTIPAGVSEIGWCAFSMCSDLKRIVLPQGVKTIASGAFSNAGLECISIPNSVTDIDSGAFDHCDQLRYVFFGGSESEWEQVRVGEYNNDALKSARFVFNTAGHIPGVPVRENETPALCEADGFYDEVIYCDDCGVEMAREQYVSPATGHSPGRRQYTETVPATCTEAGERAYTLRCDTCATILESGTETLPALEHDWGGWTTVTLATFETEGLQQRVCLRDSSHVETRILPVLTPETVIEQGWCGTNLTWTLRGDGTLTVSGTGEMYDYGYLASYYKPWTPYKDSILSVQIEDGVTHIGDYAFAGCAAVTEVRLPDTLVTIGQNAFAGCASVTQLAIPDSVEQIGGYAFCNCSALSDVTLPAGLTRIEIWTFTNDVSLKHIDIPDTVTYIGDVALSNCAFEELTLPSALQEIGNSAFTHGNFTSVTIPDGVTKIGEWAFQGSSELAEVRLPHGIAEIGSHAFAYCYRLQDVYYDGLRAEWEQVEIGEECFSRQPVIHFADGTHLCAAGDAKWVTLTQSTCGAPGTYDLVYYCMECGVEVDRVHNESDPIRHLWGDWTIVTPPTADGEGLMERRCLRDGTHVEAAAIPAGEFGEHEVLRGYCGGEGDGKNLVWTLTDDNVITITGEGRMADYGDYYISVDHINNMLPENLRKGPDAPWPAHGVDPMEIWFLQHGYCTDDEILNAMLQGEIDYADLTAAIDAGIDQPGYTVYVEPGVTYVGANAFERTNVTALSLPSTAEEIGYGAFYGLNCRELVLPEGVRWVGAHAFTSGKYESLTIPASLEGVGGGAFEFDPGISTNPCTLTVLCADENVDSILDGVSVRGMPAEMAGLQSLEDYQTVIRLSYLAEAFYVIQNIDALLDEEVDSFEEGLNVTVTPQQRENIRAYFLWAFMSEMHSLGLDFELSAQSLPYLCEEINGILGTSFTAEELFVTVENEEAAIRTDVSLSPAANARFRERFGIDYETLYRGVYHSSLKWVLQNESITVVPYLVLRGHCGSAVESNYAGELPFEAIEHDPALGEMITPSTCIAHGEGSVTCPVCGLTFTGELPTTGHTPGEPTRENVTAPGCLTMGEFDLVTRCTVCGTELASEHGYEPALGHGHTLGLNESGAPSTCTVQGYEMSICLDCGEVVESTILPLDPTNHNWGEWTVSTPATYFTEGVEQRVCSLCGGTETRPIPVLVPEQKIEDPDTGIELCLQNGVLPENTEFAVDEVFDGTYFRLLNRDVENTGSTLYNITPVADGVNVQPDGWVLVRLPLPAGYDPANVNIYYISTEIGVIERMDSYIEDGYICFQTNHFSVYAIMDASSPAETPTEMPTNNGGASLSFFVRIAAFFHRITDFFRNLFRG